MSKKSFSMPKALVSDIANTFNVVKGNLGSLNYKIVPLDAIEFDPENPRELSITKQDVTNGLNNLDPLFSIKNKELESLQQMAETIKKYGVRNAVEIYKIGTKYRLIHGERRCLASLIAGKVDITAKILDEKPNMLDLRLLQLIENAQREDLTLPDFLNNIRLVIQEYKRASDTNITVDAPLLEKLINRSRAQCFNILSVLNASHDIEKCINDGTIKSLEKASIIASEKDLSRRSEMLKACLNGASLKELRDFKQKLKKYPFENVAELQIKRRNLRKSLNKIHMGQTKKKAVIAKLIHLVLKESNYAKYAKNFSGITLSSFDSCTVAFKQLISVMEEVENEQVK